MSTIQTLNPYVLEHIFQFSDFESLKKIRLVNRLWDEGASRIFGKRSCIRIHHYYSTESITEQSQKWKDDYEKQKLRYGSLQSLKQTLQGSSNPPRFFVNFEAHVEWLSKDDNIEAKDVLDNYGKYLKSFKLQNTRFVQKVSSCPVPSRPFSNCRPHLKEFPSNFLELMTVYNALDIVLNKCPSLESLQFVTKDECKSVAGNSNKILTQFFEKRCNSDIIIPKSLNLTTVELGSYLPNKISVLFIKILKACPKLTTLRLFGGFCSPCCERIPITEASFFEKLVKHPDITRPLLEFAWIIDKKDEYFAKKFRPYHIIDVMLKMEFGPSLKILRLDSSLGDNIYHPEGSNFIRLLKKVSESLEMLELNGNYIQPYLHRYNSTKGHQIFGFGDIPSMEKLRLLKICSPNAYGLPTFTVLKSFPNLQTFWLNMEPRGYEGMLVAEKQVSLIPKFIRKNDLIQEDFVHTNLKRLYLTDKHLQDPNVAYTIWECFPNLESLYMGIGGAPPLLGEHRPYFRIDEAVEIVYGLEHLKEFSLSYTGESSSAEVCRALAHLKNFEKLEQFSLTNRTEGLKLVPDDLLKCLSELKKLKKWQTAITLYGYEVVENEDKIKLDEYIRESGLNFEILPFPSERKYPRILEY